MIPIPRTTTLRYLALAAALLGACRGSGDANAPQAVIPPTFEALQPELFSSPGGQPNAWADFDRDADLDLFVGVRGGPNHLYRNDRGTFVDVAPEVGLADEQETRAAAWGDYDGDGDLDLYIGFAAGAKTPNRLYRNDDHGRHFVDVGAEVGLAHQGETRQPVWVDYDGDGDLDLFVAFRDQPNRMYRNDGGTFTDVTEASGLGDPRRTVGAVWFDLDGDSDLDLFVANQDGDEDGVYINQGDGTFVDAAVAMGMSSSGRGEGQGGVGVAVADYDNDGDLDIFEACYGPDILWENMGNGNFRNVAVGTPLAGDHHSVAADWGDYDDDGWTDLYVGTFLSSEPQAPDHLFRNVNGTFEDVTPQVMLAQGASHGVAWGDYDNDGDLDLALANNDPNQGTDPLYVNGLPAARAARSLEVTVLDGQGRWLRAGAKVTVTAESPDPDHPVRFTTARLVGAGGGYCSQGARPVHFGLPQGVGKVDVTVDWFERGEHRSATVKGVDPAQFYAKWLEMRLGVRGDG